MRDEPMDLLEQVLNARRNVDKRAARRLCDAEGHRYQVVGRMSPTQVRCSRCRCSWAIGPKMEPAEALQTARATVVLSGYPSDLYDRDLYATWDRHTIATRTGQGGKAQARTEVLWSNRPLGHVATLFDDHEEAP